MRIPMNGLAAALLVALAGPAAAADEPAEIAALRTAMRELDLAFEHQDAAKIRSMMTPDHRAVTIYYPGPQTVDQQIASLPELELEYSDFTVPEVALLGPDAAMASYENAYRGSFQGKPVPSRVFASEIWVRSGGTWRQLFYQETVIRGR